MGFAPKGSGDPVKKWDRTHLEIFNYLPVRYQNDDLTRARVSGTITLEIRRVFVLKTMPLKQGATIDMPRRHIVLRNVTFADGKASCEILKTSLPSVLRGDTGWDYWNSFMWLVFNHAKGECLEQIGGESRNTSEFFYHFSFTREEFRRAAVNDWNWKKYEAPIPADWADHAEISFFSSEPCGRITLPYEVKSVDLPH